MSGSYEVIHVDFENKYKIEKYVSVVWNCFICTETFTYDSRNKENINRIIIRDDILKRNQQCICQACAVKIKDLVVDKDWK